MKQKQTAIGLAVFLFLLVATIQTAYARPPEDFLILDYSISIVVDCLEDAILQMAELPGFELSSRINIPEGRGRAQRIIESRDRTSTIDALARIGTVTSTDTNSENAFASWTALRREIAIRQREYERLVELLHETITTAAFEAVEVRLGSVISTMNRLRGELQGLEFEIGTTVIDITLSVPAQVIEEPIPTPEPTPTPEPGSMARIGSAFTSSASATGRVAQGIAMFLAYISIPLAGILAVAAIVMWARKRNNRPGGDVNEK